MLSEFLNKYRDAYSERKRLFQFHKMIRKNWPIYSGLGLEFKTISADFTKFEVALPLNRKTRGMRGTHFGGALFAFVDPIPVFAISQYLGPDYLVWDTKAEIHFLKATDSDVRAKVSIEISELNRIREECTLRKKTISSCRIDILDNRGNTIATVEKQIYIRKTAAHMQKSLHIRSSGK